MKYIDIHGQVNFPDYDTDREETIKRAADAGVGMICVGNKLESSKECVKLAKTHGDMWAIVGLHPIYASGSKGSEEFDKPAFLELAKHPKVVAIGECGLDYFHSTPADMAKQKEVFIQHIEIANELKKPLMLHVRNGGAKYGSKAIAGENASAYQEAIQILKDHAKVPANFHFFAGTTQDLADIIAMGNTVSYTGVITFTKDYDALIKAAPIDKILSETDCPFVAPVPYRGKRNEPSYVIEVAKRIAQIRGEDEAKVAAQLLANAQKFFGI